MKILFTGGGTGGHIFPIIAIIREMRRIYPQEKFQFFYLGPKDVFASIVLEQEGIKAKTVLAGKIRRYLTWQGILKNILDIFFKIPLGFLQSFGYLFIISPDIVFSTGGYGSFSATLSAWILQIPIFLHEADKAAGLSNSFLSKFAVKIFTSFESTEGIAKEKTILAGMPIRREILAGDRGEAKRIFGLSEQKPVILILGGSQGAQRLNDMLLAILPDILKDFELVHTTGERNFAQVQKEANSLLAKESKQYYHIFPFLKEQELKHIYSVLDLVVGRAGAGTIFEIAALGKPSILVPLPEAARDHQVKNAYTYAKSGAALVLEEANLTPRFFLEKVKFLFSHPQELDKMKQASKEFARPEAAQKIARTVKEYFK